MLPNSLALNTKSYRRLQALVAATQAHVRNNMHPGLALAALKTLVGGDSSSSGGSSGNSSAIQIQNVQAGTGWQFGRGYGQAVSRLAGSLADAAAKQARLSSATRLLNWLL